VKIFDEIIKALTQSTQFPSEDEKRNWVKADLIPPFQNIWAAVDGKKHPCLLIEVPPDTSNISTESQMLKSEIFTTSSPTSNQSLRIMKLWVEDERFKGVFGSLCQRLISLIGDLQLENRPEAIGRIFRTWKYFWARPSSGISQSDEIGLFGELWFLHNWISDTSAGIESWTGGGFNSTIRDFQFQNFDVEVKTTKSHPPSLIHRINGLQQLETNDEEHRLFLFSCGISAENDAGNTLFTLFNNILEKVYRDPHAEAMFVEKLTGRGFDPGSTSFSQFTIRIENLYEVRDNFPRIIPESFKDSVPAGIPSEKVTYSLDMSFCDKWIATNTPEEIR
jgi:hypothetical protein